MDVEQPYFYSRNQIDDARWDNAIEHSSNAMPYALSWFLDAVTPNWNALILGEYDYVMPLPTKQKFGINYYIQPYWTQQLGIFSEKPIDQKIQDLFFKQLKRNIYALKINHANPLGEEMPNYILPLNQHYDNIKTSYHTNTQRNIKKANTQQLTITTIKPSEFFPFWASQHTNDNILLEHLQRIAHNALQHQSLNIVAALLHNNIVSAALTITHCSRIVFLAPVSDKTGKETKAMFAIVDHIVQTNAETPQTLDFEGSRIPGVRRFYESFGAINQPYYFVEHFHPHWLVKLLHA
ncbi:MAG: hypothetical protein Q4D14_02475 [Bacteroidales bacterium]|nr:hypothetical protein [Bacteroidales bacterium]